MTDSPQPLHKSVASILASGDTMTAADCAELLRDVRLRVAAIGARTEAIQTTPRGTGALRRKAMLAGDVETLRQFDAELLDLQAERQCLQGQAAELERMHNAATAREAAAARPDHLRALAEALDTAERRKRDYDAAIAEVEGCFVTAWRARVTAERGGHKVEAADGELVSRMIRVGARVQSEYDMRVGLGVEPAHDHLAPPTPLRAVS